MRLIIGSRGSRLALCQANWVKAELERKHSGLEVEISVIKTSGDVFKDAPLSKIGGKGLFTKEIEEALLERRIDLAVHSLKDLPTVLPADLCLSAITRREDVRDAFLSKKYASLVALPARSRLGTSSLRRQVQLLHLRPDLEVTDLRGNVDTRLRKLDEGQYDGIILACAGLIRLGLDNRIRERISIDQICPAVGQGALGIETRHEDHRTNEMVRSLNHPESHVSATAERAFLKRLGGGCQVPIAATAWVEEQKLRLRGVVAGNSGKQIFQKTLESVPEDAEQLGIRLAENLLSIGAGEILIEHSRIE